MERLPTERGMSLWRRVWLLQLPCHVPERGISLQRGIHWQESSNRKIQPRNTERKEEQAVQKRNAHSLIASPGEEETLVRKKEKKPRTGQTPTTTQKLNAKDRKKKKRMRKETPPSHVVSWIAGEGLVGAKGKGGTYPWEMQGSK